MKIIKMALQNLNRKKRRSLLLAGAIAFGFMVVIVIDGISTGCLIAMEQQISKIMGGHVLLGSSTNSEKDSTPIASIDKETMALFNKVIDEADVKVLYVTRSSTNFGRLFFSNNAVSIAISGRELAHDEALRESLVFIEGSLEKSVNTENALILPKKIVETLKVEIGDELLFETKTEAGQNTLVDFELTGILKADEGMGTFNMYTNIEYMNVALGLKREDTGNVNLFLKNPNAQESVAKKIALLLEPYGDVINKGEKGSGNSEVTGSQLLSKLKERGWTGRRFISISIKDIIPELWKLRVGVQNISLVILLVLLVITMIGIANTFKMVIHERTSEIGTMRACGMKRKTVRFLFLTEAVFLSLIGVFVGTVLGFIVMTLITFIPFSPDSPFSFFTKGGYLMWNISVSGFILKVLPVILLTIGAVLFPAAKAARMLPAEALRSI